MGALSILNAGAGDIKLSYDKNNTRIIYLPGDRKLGYKREQIDEPSNR